MNTNEYPCIPSATGGFSMNCHLSSLEDPKGFWAGQIVRGGSGLQQRHDRAGALNASKDVGNIAGIQLLVGGLCVYIYI